jgi:hypothetical protein
MSQSLSYGFKSSIDTSRPRWKSWQGNHTFFCNGRIMLGFVHIINTLTYNPKVCCGFIVSSPFFFSTSSLSLSLFNFRPNAGHLCVTAALCLTLWCSIFFLILPFLPVISSANPGWGGAACIWKFWMPLFLFLLNEVLLLLTALVEPGIVPHCQPQLVTLSLAQELRVYSRTTFCSVCQVVRPPRSRHCRYCGCCVAELDHHCPWVGTCIGKRNYSFFFAFVTSVVVSSIYLLLNAIWLCLSHADVRVGLLGDELSSGIRYVPLLEEIHAGFDVDATDEVNGKLKAWRTAALAWGIFWSLAL